MRNPDALGAGAQWYHGDSDAAESTAAVRDPQAAARAISAGLTCQPDHRDMATILRARLDVSQRLWGAAAIGFEGEASLIEGGDDA